MFYVILFMFCIEMKLKKIGQNVAKFRKARPLSQKDAADQAGISYRYYQGIESGAANITMVTLVKLAHFLGVHPCDLLPSKFDK